MANNSKGAARWAAKHPGWQATRAEHGTYNLFWLGQNLLWGFAGMVATFLTDLGIDAVTAGALLLAPKIWDAINDTLFGYIVDRYTWKNGQKFMPWIKLGVGGVAIAVIAMFFIPSSLSQGWKIAWFLIGYIIFDIFYTLLDAPAFSMSTVMTSNIPERTAFISGNKLWAMVGGVLSTVLIGVIRSKIGWGWAAVVFCGIGGLMMIPYLFTGKERREMSEEEKEEKFTFRQMWNYLKANGQLTICLIAFFIFGMTSIESTMSLYLARTCLGGEGNSMYIAAAVAVPVIIVSALIPTIAKKVDKFWIMVFGLLGSIVIGIAAWFVGYSNMISALIFIGLKCMGMAVWQVIIYMLVADTIEYGNYKSGTRATGITFALQCFIAKMKNAFLASFVLFMLGFIGFVEGENAVQPAGVADGLFGMFIFIPIAGYVLALAILLLFYKLRDKSVQVMAKYNNGEISYDECMAAIGDEFGEPAIVK